MSRDYIPSRDASLLSWSAHFASLVAASPVSLGVTVPQATELTTYQVEFANTLATCTNPISRTKSACIAKRLARQQLVTFARKIAQIIQANPAVAEPTKADLGITIRKTSHAPTPVPDTEPGTRIAGTYMRDITLNVFDAASETKRGKPAGAVGAKVYTYVGASYPSNPLLWAYQGDATRDKFVITLDDSVPGGSQVWVCAAWFNRRGETGRISMPISTYIQGGGGAEQAQAMNTPETQGVKLAA